MEVDARFDGVGTSSKKRAVYADLEALPPNVVGQIIDGELIAFPRPAADHAIATSALGVILGSAMQFGRDGPGGWWILDEPEIHWGDDVLVPDIAGWRRERLARPSGAALTVSPDWVCEALSPSTASVDRVRKMRVYAREQVGYVWLVDPIGHTLEVFERTGGEWKRIGAWADEDRVSAPPFEAVEVELRLLWPPAP